MDIADIIKDLDPADRCGAKTRSGEPCRNAKMRPAGRCRMHGGKSWRGIASPRYVHGRRSKYLIVRLCHKLADEYAAGQWSADDWPPAPTEQELAETSAMLAEICKEPIALPIDPVALDRLLAELSSQPDPLQHLL